MGEVGRVDATCGECASYIYAKGGLKAWDTSKRVSVTKDTRMLLHCQVCRGGEIDAPALSCRYTSYLALRGSVSESRSDPIL